MNEHVEAALDVYLDAPSLPVPHAFLVEGPWGSGKTHFLKERYERAYANRRAQDRKPALPFVFVSLFGVNSADEFQRRIFHAANPMEAAISGMIGTIALGAGGFFGVEDAVEEGRGTVLKKSLDRLAECVFVFDDLERVEPEALGEIMGVVNDLIEKHKRRVILVADETKITDERFSYAQWDLRNEKIVGRRVRIDPAIEEVLTDFVDRDINDDQVRSVLKECQAELRRTIELSGSDNLRNLRWALNNCAIFVKHLLAINDVPNDHIKRSASVVLATTLEMRQHGMELDDLKSVPGVGFRYALASMRRGHGSREGSDPAKDKARVFVERYKELNLESPPLDYCHVYNLERRGVLDDELLREWLGEQFSFGQEFTEPSWRRLWHAGDRPVADTERAIHGLTEELQAHRHVEHGVILHCVGLALTLREQGDTRITSGEEVVPFFERYIDELAAERRLPPKPDDDMRFLDEGYGQLGYSAKDHEDFLTIRTHLAKKSSARLREDRNQRAIEHLSRAEHGQLGALSIFYSQEDWTLSKRPVLQDIEPERIVRLASRDSPELAAVAELLAYRYHSLRDKDPLISELDWARKVISNIVGTVGQRDEIGWKLACRRFIGLIKHYDSERLEKFRLMEIDPTDGENANGTETVAEA